MSEKIRKRRFKIEEKRGVFSKKMFIKILIKLIRKKGFENR